MNLTANITAAIHVANQLTNSNERRELVHAVEYAQSSPSEHSRQRLIKAVNAASAGRWIDLPKEVANAA